MAVKALGATVGAVFLPFVFLLLLLSSCDAARPQLTCAVAPEASPQPPTLTDAQAATAAGIVERILERQGSDSGFPFDTTDPWLAAVAITAALHGSDLTTTPEGTPTFRNPFTGAPSTESFQQIVDDFYDRATSDDDWRALPPTQLAAWVIGEPGAELAPHWNDAAFITAGIAGTTAQDLIDELEVDPICEQALSVDWEGATLTSTGWAFPVTGSSRITSPFGYRVHPIYHVVKLHTGTDIAAACGTPVVAAQSGVVVRASENVAGYGTLIEIAHLSGERTRYAHMTRGLAVRPGDDVMVGQPIALVGKAGTATGCHLHFELITRQGKLVDPMRAIGWEG